MTLFSGLGRAIQKLEKFNLMTKNAFNLSVSSSFLPVQAVPTLPRETAGQVKNARVKHFIRGGAFADELVRDFDLNLAQAFL